MDVGRCVKIPLTKTSIMVVCTNMSLKIMAPKSVKIQRHTSDSLNCKRTFRFWSKNATTIIPTLL